MRKGGLRNDGKESLRLRWKEVMIMTIFERPGTYPKPGPIGRIVRLLLGLLLLNGFIDSVPA